MEIDAREVQFGDTVRIECRYANGLVITWEGRVCNVDARETGIVRFECDSGIQFANTAARDDRVYTVTLISRPQPRGKGVAI